MTTSILNKITDFIYLSFHNLKSYSFSNIECNNDIKLFLEQQKPSTLNDLIFDYNPDKETIIICDDSLGVCTFVEDDLKDLTKQKYNIISFYGADAIYKCIEFCETFEITPSKAIIDLIIGGVRKIYFDDKSKTTNNSTKKYNLKLDGVDLFEYLYLKNQNLDYLFFTGNTLSPEITFIDKMMNQFRKLTGLNLESKSVAKMTFTLDERLTKFKKLLKL